MGYFTDEKIIETLEFCQDCAINTIITGSGSAPLLRKYWDERGGRIQWIAQVAPQTNYAHHGRWRSKPLSKISRAIRTSSIT